MAQTRALGREGVRGVCVYGSTCACVCTLYSMEQMYSFLFNTCTVHLPWNSGGARGPPEAPCAAQQCGNGAPALRVAQSTDFPI